MAGQNACERETIASRVLRLEYYTIKNAFGAEKFEELITILHLSGTNVGDKNR